METKFKVGDKVRIINTELFASDVKVGDIATIISDDYELQFNGFIQAVSPHKASTYIAKCEVGYKVIFKDNATILFKDGKKYVAKCEAGDIYDKEKGLLVCLAKANGISFNVLQEMLKSAEDNAVKEVKRQAKVGEYIKIVNAYENECKYNNGDILKVKEKMYFDNVKTFYNGIGNTHSYGYNYINADEYVVLENYKPNNYKITLSEFLSNGEIAVNLKNKAEYEEFIKECHKRDVLYFFDKQYEKEHLANKYKENFCIDNDGCCFKKWYKTNFYKIYNFDEVDLSK